MASPRYNNLTYCTPALAAIVSNKWVALAVETSDETLRKSNDGIKAVLKFEGEVPHGIPGPFFTHEQILAEMRKPNWIGPPEPWEI